MPDSLPPDALSATPHQRYWRRNLRLTMVLLTLWFVVSFGFMFWADELNASVLGWPFSFWMAAQGALLIYCAIVWYYAWAMGRLDAAYAEGGDQNPRSREASASG